MMLHDDGLENAALTTVFISYRRDDAAGWARSLQEVLRREFPECKVFYDISSIGIGEDWVNAMRRALASCAVVIAMIGPHWLNATDEGGNRRLDDPEDWVRLELTESLQREGLRVVPVLVGRASMPRAAALPEPLKPLAQRNAHEITDERWDYDVAQLVAALHGILTLVGRLASPVPESWPQPAAKPKPELWPAVTSAQLPDTESAAPPPPSTAAEAPKAQTPPIHKPPAKPPVLIPKPPPTHAGTDSVRQATQPVAQAKPLPSRPGVFAIGIGGVLVLVLIAFVAGTRDSVRPTSEPTRSPYSVAPNSTPQVTPRSSAPTTALVSQLTMTPTPPRDPGTFTIHVAAFKAREAADSIASNLKRKGFDAFVIHRGDDALFLVRVGSFTSRADAELIQEKLRDQERLKPFLIRQQ